MPPGVWVTLLANESFACLVYDSRMIQARLDKAKRSSTEWSKTRTSLDWKDWVKGDTRVSKHFLTQAVNEGELLVPVKKPLKPR